MSLQPADKKALTWLAVAVAAAVAIVAVATTLLVRGHTAEPPRISVGADRQLERIAPTFWCDLEMQDCRPRAMSSEELAQLPTQSFPVPIGSSLSLSVPTEIAESPWMLTALYAGPDGVQEVTWFHRSKTTYTQLLPSTPDRVLQIVMVRPFSRVLIDAPDGPESGQGDILFRGQYTIETAPIGFSVPNATELPAINANAAAR
ncbi:hypothetical protein GOHSU_50_00020 [Gordonia hirsuta DSM 44140 = NBRC 16056]|uniref:DUF2771 domain-containing protein n=1 Tax=Gordonia hirsuta DSM 44140 = NBRC 16056 TaxID=1121927 RepID=L7LCX9_9ACTN|nr:DUF2771 family protein [Gordonia hirsuta]GAC58774.1 hypothetical protein GOHSU_50_00020 [Gordonia hirsuta DSM 44140 = NBRC 16056]